jgi:hypothetical protein
VRGRGVFGGINCAKRETEEKRKTREKQRESLNNTSKPLSELVGKQDALLTGCAGSYFRVERVEFLAGQGSFTVRLTQ